MTAEIGRIVWVSWIPMTGRQGGGGTYSRSMAESFRRAFPEAEFVEFAHNRTKGGTLVAKAKAVAMLWSPWPAKVRYGRCQTVIERLRSLQDDGRRTLVVLDSSESLSFLGEVPGFCETVHLSHNVDWILYEDRIRRMGPLAGVVARIGGEVPKFRSMELNGIRSVGHLVSISSDDVARFARQTGRPHPRATSIPPVFHYAPAAGEAVDGRRNVSFLADYRWPPNAEGIARFIERCWDPSRGWRLNLYGIESERFADTSRNIHSMGYVEDISDVWNATDVMIAPIWIGGGINIKTCEAIFNRVPMVATEFALRGLPGWIRDEVGPVEDDGKWMDSIEKAARPSQAASDYFSGERAVAAIRSLLGHGIQASSKEAA